MWNMNTESKMASLNIFQINAYFKAPLLTNLFMKIDTYGKDISSYVFKIFFILEFISTILACCTMIQVKKMSISVQALNSVTRPVFLFGLMNTNSHKATLSIMP